MLEEEGLRLITQLTNNKVHETAVWPKDFTAVNVTALKKPKATKFSYHRTISPVAHRTVAARITKNKAVLTVFADQLSVNCLLTVCQLSVNCLSTVC